MPRAMTFAVDGRISRDVTGFTEGLEVRDHQIYESTGSLYGGSRLIRLAPDGHATVMVNYGDAFFGEGLTILGDQIYQLTWKDHWVFVYDRVGNRQRVMRNDRQGWGLTNDGSRLIFGDGGDRLYFADPRSFAVDHSVVVRRGGRSVDDINELEYVDGAVYANIFETRRILRIDPLTGCVQAEARLDNLWDQMSPSERSRIDGNDDFVLNGIAYDHESKVFYVTGKVWPVIFRGHFVDN